MKKKLGFMTDHRFIIGVQIVLSIILMISIIFVKVLPMRYLIVIGSFLAVLALLVYLVAKPGPIVSRKVQKRPLAGKIISVIISIFLIIGCIFIQSGKAAYNKVTSEYDYVTYSLVVRKNSKYKKMDDLLKKTVGYNPNGTKINEALNRLSKKVSNYGVSELYGVEAIVDALYDKKVDAILINEGSRDLVTDYKKNFDKDTRVIWTTKFKSYNKIKEEKTLDVLKDPFCVYISGIDSRGSVQEVSRSDVNILMTINVPEHKVLLTSIPRDAYVTLADAKQKDKLTHSGLTGTQNTVKTVENFLDVDISYYARVNFESLVEVVDALGGVDVYSDKDLSVWNGQPIKEGWNHMNGQMALAFSRERHAYTTGDRHRAQNQQAVLQAIIRKMASPAIITHYTDILKSIEGTFVTDMPMNEMARIANDQLNTNASWSFQSSMVAGNGLMMKGGYYMPGTRLYYLIPDENSVEQNKQYIKKMLKGEEFTVE